MRKIAISLFSASMMMCVACGSSNSESSAAANSDSADGVATEVATSAVEGDESSAPDPVAEIMREVESANAKCPVTLGMGNNLVMRGLSFEDNTLTYDYTLDRINDGVDLNNENFKNSLLYMLKGETDANANSNRFIRNIIKVGGKLAYKYTTPSGKSISVEISNKELSDFFN